MISDLDVERARVLGTRLRASQHLNAAYACSNSLTAIALEFRPLRLFASFAYLARPSIGFGGRSNPLGM